MVTFHMCRECVRAYLRIKLNLIEICELVRISACRFLAGGGLPLSFYQNRNTTRCVSAELDNASAQHVQFKVQSQCEGGC